MVGREGRWWEGIVYTCIYTCIYVWPPETESGKNIEKEDEENERGLLRLGMGWWELWRGNEGLRESSMFGGGSGINWWRGREGARGVRGAISKGTFVWSDVLVVGWIYSQRYLVNSDKRLLTTIRYAGHCYQIRIVNTRLKYTSMLAHAIFTWNNNNILNDILMWTYNM